jgi:U3 small nucleolar RNA-associated protein 4
MYLTEWDITTGLPKQHLASNAGPIWSLAASPDGQTLALGCEDGTVMLVDVADGSFNYSRFLERQHSRVLSLSWHPNGTILVGGCADSTIRAWQAVDEAIWSPITSLSSNTTRHILCWSLGATAPVLVYYWDSKACEA